MDNQNNELTNIKNMANNLFVKQEVDFSKPNVIASIVTAGSEMAFYSEITTPLEARDVLLEAYESTGIEEIENLIGLNPAYVKSNIGYSVIFDDFSRGKVSYDAEKAKYDALYQQIREQIDKKDQELGR